MSRSAGSLVNIRRARCTNLYVLLARRAEVFDSAVIRGAQLRGVGAAAQNRNPVATTTNRMNTRVHVKCSISTGSGNLLLKRWSYQTEKPSRKWSCVERSL